ncbi:imelysin family protein [Polaribacter sargassicola]|uniref:imelysin family protein n=1 Tax=Polaribacter sargassicola TaxID=2836891 RepID=UPI001F2BC640|nr:imelysin family protein [Polaribacter sp. DS7-9]MCG1037036.1 imelysin family protein [Polaribacter sp. DS7-9]
MIKKVHILFIFVATIFVSCSSSTSEEEEEIVVDNFDRGAMLTNIADNIIIPAYTDFSTKMTALKSAGETFTETPNQTNLENLRSSWLVAYKTWQYLEVFNFGKAEEIQYSFYMNVYPLTVLDVETNISNGSYDLTSVNNQDAQGFPAIDYLLYGVADSDVTIIEKYTTDENSEGYKNYLTDVLNQMTTLTEQVFIDWSSYRNEFVSSTSNTATSAVNILVNDYVYYYEKGLRANKFGIPAGVFSSTALPEKVEAYYSRIYSKELALEALVAVEALFKGNHYNSSTAGVGFDDYLIDIEREDISTSIINQIEVARTQINTLNSDFYEQINTNDIAILKAYDELQKVVVLLKVDMLQAFNISVDYVDADGD